LLNPLGAVKMFLRDLHLTSTFFRNLGVVKLVWAVANCFIQSWSNPKVASKVWIWKGRGGIWKHFAAYPICQIEVVETLNWPWRCARQTLKWSGCACSGYRGGHLVLFILVEWCLPAELELSHQ